MGSENYSPGERLTAFSSSRIERAAADSINSMFEKMLSTFNSKMSDFAAKIERNAKAISPAEAKMFSANVNKEVVDIQSRTKTINSEIKAKNAVDVIRERGIVAENNLRIKNSGKLEEFENKKIIKEQQHLHKKDELAYRSQLSAEKTITLRDDKAERDKVKSTDKIRMKLGDVGYFSDKLVSLQNKWDFNNEKYRNWTGDKRHTEKRTALENEIASTKAMMDAAQIQKKAADENAKNANASRIIAAVSTIVGSSAVTSLIRNAAEQSLVRGNNMYTSGFNYGGVVGSLTNLRASQTASMLEGVGDMAVGAGMFFGFPGMAAGTLAKIGTGIASSYVQAQGMTQAQAQEQLVNANMSRLILKNINTPAAAYLNKFDKSKMAPGEYIQKTPHMVAISNAFANINPFGGDSRTLNDILSYSITSQFSPQQAAGYTSSVAQMKRLNTGFNEKKFERAITAYGVSGNGLDEFSRNTFLAMQNGYGQNTSMEMAGRISQMAPIQKGVLTSFLSESMSSKTNKSFIYSQLLGRNMAEDMSGSNDFLYDTRIRMEGAYKSGKMANPMDQIIEMLAGGNLTGFEKTVGLKEGDMPENGPSPLSSQLDMLKKSSGEITDSLKENTSATINLTAILGFMAKSNAFYGLAGGKY